MVAMTPPGMAKTVSVVREKTKKPTPVSSAMSLPSMPGFDPTLGPAGLDNNRDAWANALSSMSGVYTPDPLSAVAKVAGMGLAGYGQGKATKAKEAGGSAYRSKLAEALSGTPDNTALMGLMADPYADDNSQRMLMEIWKRNNPTQDELQQRQMRELQMQQTQQGMTAQQQQQDEIQRQAAIRGGKQDAVSGFMQQQEAAGGDLFDPNMQAWLRSQGVAGADPADTQRYDAMQPYAQAGDYESAFQQMAAPVTASGTDWEQVTLDDGVYAVDKANPQNRVKIGERPNRNEGEGRDFTQESKLRGEYMTESKPFTDLRVNYQKILASSKDNNGASDIAMVYSFMKMLDPTSVVREGEFATAENAGGVPTQILTMYNRAVSGERLAPEIRQQFLQQASRQYEQQLQTHQQIMKKYGDLAAKLGLDPANVAPDITYGVTVAPNDGGPTVDDLLKHYGGGN